MSPVVEVLAADTKNGKVAIQALRPELVGMLQPWLADKPADEHVFKLPKNGRMLRRDLESAGIAYEDEKAEVFDFRTLRHTFLTLLILSGASPKVAQLRARHSTPTLTIGRYAHAETVDRPAAPDALPSLDAAMTNAIPSMAINADGAANAHQSGDGQGHAATRLDLASSIAAASERSRKSLRMWGLDALLRHLAEPDANAPRRTRTYNPLIKSQLLCQLS